MEMEKVKNRDESQHYHGGFRLHREQCHSWQTGIEAAGGFNEQNWFKSF